MTIVNVIYQSNFNVMFGAQTTPTPSSLTFSESPSALAKPYLAALQIPEIRFLAQTPASTPTAFGFSPSPELFKKPFAAAQQENIEFEFNPPGPLAATAFGYSASPEVFGRPLHPKLMQANDFQVIIPGAVTPTSLVFSDQAMQYFKLGVARLVEATAYDSTNAFSAPTPGPLAFSESPIAIKSAIVPAPYRRYETVYFKPAGTVTPSIFPFGPSPAIFNRGFPAYLMQHDVGWNIPFIPNVLADRIMKNTIAPLRTLRNTMKPGVY